MKDKALIKNNEKTLDVESQYTIMNFTASAVYEIFPSEEKQILKRFYTRKEQDCKEGNNFTLSDGKVYHEDELIVGKDNIREYKLNKIIKE